MNADHDPSREAADLRHRAEARLREHETQAGREPPTAAEAQRLIHELQVHQIELEMQNEALRETQAQLERSLERYTDLYDFAPVGYFTVTGDGTIHELNLAGAALLGLERSRLVGRRFGLFVSGQTRSEFNAFLDRILAGHAQEQCEIVLDREGKPPCHLRLEGLGADSGAGWRCRLAAVDITALREAQQALEAHRAELEQQVRARTAELAASEARFRGIVEQSLAGIIILQGDRFRYVNPGFAGIHGFDEPEQIIDRIAPAELIASEDRETVTTKIRRLLDGAENPGPVTFTGLRRDGSRIALDVYANLLDYQGQPAAIGLVLDVTARQQAERAREAALAAAEHLTQLKSAFLRNASHELRTPLNGIFGPAYLGQRANDLAKAREWFGRILQSAQQLQHLIEHILDFSGIEAGRLTLAPVPCALAEILDRAVESIDAKARAKGLIFRDERASDLPRYVLADGPRLAQALRHLLDNAVKFTERGGVALSAARDGERLVFRVADTGIGMTPDQIARTLHPFEQVDGSTTRRFGGLGLGLALVDLLVRRMGGSLAVDSAPGQGTAFAVRLPLVEASPDAAASTKAPAPRLAGVHVLAVDDHETNRWLLGSLLELEGATAVLTETGRQAVERLQRDGDAAYDLVLTDLQMPEWDGFETARRIRDLAPTLPVIGVASVIEPGIKQLGAAAGMVDLLFEPLELDVLVDTVQRWARRKGDARA